MRSRSVSESMLVLRGGAPGSRSRSTGDLEVESEDIDSSGPMGQRETELDELRDLLDELQTELDNQPFVPGSSRETYVEKIDEAIADGNFATAQQKLVEILSQMEKAQVEQVDLTILMGTYRKSCQVVLLR